MSRAFGSARLLARHLRDSAARWLVLGVVVAVASTMIALWPRWLEETAATEIERSLTGSSAAFVDPVAVSALWLNPVAHIDSVPAPDLAAAEAVTWGTIEEAMDTLRAAQPDVLRSRLSAPELAAVYGPGQVASEQSHGTLTLLEPTLAPGLDEHVTYVQGRAPEYVPYLGDLAAEYDETGAPDLTGPEQQFAVEVAMSAEIAQRLSWPVGEQRRAGPAQAVAFELVGTYAPTDAAASYWQHLPGMLRPRIEATADGGEQVFAQVLVRPGHGGLHSWGMSGFLPPSLRLWFGLETTMSTREAASLARDLSSMSQTSVDLFGYSLRFGTDAPRLIETTLGRQRATNDVLSLAVAAPAGVALILLALAATVIVAPRRSALALMRARGAHAGRIRAWSALEALLVSVPAAAAGQVLGAALLQAPAPRAWWALAIALALAPPLGLAVSAGRPRPRARLVAEITVAVAAVAAVAGTMLAGDRGVFADQGPLVVAMPLLVCVLAAIVCVRVLPLVLSRLADRLRRRAELVAPLGSTLAVRRPVSLIATTAVLTGVAVAILGQVMVTTLDRAAHAAAHADVGADLRISGRLTEERALALAEVDGVAGVAPITPVGGASTVLVTADASQGVRLFAVDPQALAEVQEEVPGAMAPAEAVPGEPVPIVVATATGLPPGTLGELDLGDGIEVEVTGRAVTAPGVTQVSAWTLIDIEAIRAIGLDLPATTTLVALTDGADPDRVARDIASVMGPDATVITYEAGVAERTDAPTARALNIGLVVVGALGLGGAFVAVVLTLAADAGPRTRVLAVMRTLGLRAHGALALTLWSVLPAVGSAIVAGVGVAVGLSWLILRSVDLSAFTQSAAPPPMILSGWLALTIAAVALVMLGAAVVAARRATTRSTAVVLRVGEGAQ